MGNALSTDRIQWNVSQPVFILAINFYSLRVEIYNQRIDSSTSDDVKLKARIDSMKNFIENSLAEYAIKEHVTIENTKVKENLVGN